MSYENKEAGSSLHSSKQRAHSVPSHQVARQNKNRVQRRCTEERTASATPIILTFTLLYRPGIVYAFCSSNFPAPCCTSRRDDGFDHDTRTRRVINAQLILSPMRRRWPARVSKRSVFLHPRSAVGVFSCKMCRSWCPTHLCGFKRL